jgi:uncharacterized DUF497 family protein
VWPEEVEEAFFNPPYKVRSVESGKHLLFGQSEDGRCLLIVFAWQGRQIRIITARDMTHSEDDSWVASEDKYVQDSAIRE